MVGWHTQVQQERQTVEHQEVRNVIDANTVNQGQLFFRRRHKDEPGSEEQERCEMLEGGWLVTSGFILKHEADLNYTGGSGGHQGVAKHSVNH